MQLWVASLAVYFATHEIMMFMITYISCLWFCIFLVFYPCSALILFEVAQLPSRIQSLGPSILVVQILGCGSRFSTSPKLEGVRSSR